MSDQHPVRLDIGDRKIIKREVFDEFVEAESLIESARSRASEILRVSQEKAYTLETDGYGRGIVRGYDEGIENFQVLHAKVSSEIERLQYDIGGLLRHILVEVLGEFDETELVRRAIRRAIGDIRADHVEIAVCETARDSVEEFLSYLFPDENRRKTYTVVVDPGIGEGNVVLRYADTAVNISPRVQVDRAVDLATESLED